MTVTAVRAALSQNSGRQNHSAAGRPRDHDPFERGGLHNGAGASASRGSGSNS